MRFALRRNHARSDLICGRISRGGPRLRVRRLTRSWVHPEIDCPQLVRVLAVAGLATDRAAGGQRRLTVPQPMPGKQVPGDAGETVGSAIGATTAAADVVAGDQ